MICFLPSFFCAGVDPAAGGVRREGAAKGGRGWVMMERKSAIRAGGRRVGRRFSLGTKADRGGIVGGDGVRSRSAGSDSRLLDRVEILGSLVRSMLKVQEGTSGMQIIYYRVPPRLPH